MSLTTWTPALIASKATQFAETLCRFVTKNRYSSIVKITDNDEELAEVEKAISLQISSLKESFSDLHPLLKLPFTTKSYSGGSRFRAQFDSGVFYGADTIETAAAERGYHHHLFVKNSPALLSSGATPFTFFTVKTSMDLVDVRMTPFSKSPEIFQNKSSYLESQRFASLVRQSGVAGIAYKSVRNPKKALCVALLSPSGFAAKQPISWDENWSCIADAKGVRWFNNSSRATKAEMSFKYD